MKYKQVFLLNLDDFTEDIDINTLIDYDLNVRVTTVISKNIWEKTDEVYEFLRIAIRDSTSVRSTTRRVPLGW